MVGDTWRSLADNYFPPAHCNDDVIDTWRFSCGYFQFSMEKLGFLAMSEYYILSRWIQASTISLQSQQFHSIFTCKPSNPSNLLYFLFLLPPKKGFPLQLHNAQNPPHRRKWLRRRTHNRPAHRPRPHRHRLYSLSFQRAANPIHPPLIRRKAWFRASDYAAPGTWDEIIKEGDFDYVIHSAAPLLDDERNKDFEKDFLGPSVNGWVFWIDPYHSCFERMEMLIWV